MLEDILSLLLLLFLFCISKVFRLKYTTDLVLVTFGFFGIVYYFVPLILREVTGLVNVDISNLLVFIFFNILFLFFFVLGLSLFKVNLKTSRVNTKFLYLNTYLFKKSNFLFFLSFTIAIVVDQFFNMSVYNDGVSDENISIPFKGLFAMITTFAQCIMCLTLIFSLKKEKGFKKKIKVAFFIVFLLLQTLSIQRLHTIRLFLLLAFISFILYQDKKLLKKVFVLVPIILLVTSPIYTFMRHNLYLTNGNGFTTDFAIEQSKKYFNDDTNTDGFVSKGMEIVLQRADLIATSLTLIPYIENEDFDTSTYFLSVIQQYIPGFLLKDKLYPMSDDGTAYGELSIISYGIKNGYGKLGSLTVFGAISAYREGGVFWLIINGFLTGASLSFIIKHLVKYNYIGAILISLLVFNCVIKKVPASLADLIINLVSIIYLFVFSYFLDILIKLNKN
jgi:hypothetical protein